MSTLSDIFDGVGSFVSDNSGWIKPIVGAGLGYLQGSTNNSYASSYADALEKQNQANYANYLSNLDAYNKYQTAASSASAANRAAAASARAANDKASMAAAKKALKYETKAKKEAFARYQPYVDAANSLLPKRTALAGQGLDLLSTLGQQLAGQTGKLSGSNGPAWTINVPVPEYLKRK